jgi:hypothetical protein
VALEEDEGAEQVALLDGLVGRRLLGELGRDGHIVEVECLGVGHGGGGGWGREVWKGQGALRGKKVMSRWG